MSLYVKTFSGPNDLVQFVNDEPVAQANVQKIIQLGGRWYLFWWA